MSELTEQGAGDMAKASAEVVADISLLLDDVEARLSDFLTKYVALIMMRDTLKRDLLKLQFYTPLHNQKAKQIFAELIRAIDSYSALSKGES